MRKSFGPKPWLYPQPVLILGTFDEDGTPDAMNAAWGGISDADEIFVSLSLDHKTVENIRKKGALTISVGTKDMVAECDYLGIVSGNKIKDKVARAGLTWVRSEKVDAPLFDQLPLAFECKVASLDKETGILRAKILDTLAEESILTEGKIDPRKLGAIAFDGATSSYLLVGEEIAKAFSVGKKHL